jgi:16S rRNA G1207 methylase RsmC
MQRYPPTTNRSLRPRSAADDLLTEWSGAHAEPEDRVVVLHDRFGAVALGVTGTVTVTFIATFHSQVQALRLNAGDRPIAVGELTRPVPDFNVALLRVPKSLDLFEYYLQVLVSAALPGSRIVCGFMTRHYTPRILELANRYAGRCRQSRARRKARLLVLEDVRREDGKADGRPGACRAAIPFGDKLYRQYPGVFSAGRIDPATQFLLRRWEVVAPYLTGAPGQILDIGCGNGIIGDQLLRRYPDAELIAFDDHILAVTSARLNLPGGRSQVHWGHRIADTGIEAADLVVSNPPFHLGYETNIEVSLSLFNEAHGVLRPGGVLVVVANLHLNYLTHLRRLFVTEEVSRDGKYAIYVARKAVG